MTRPDRLSYLLAVHVLDATPGLQLNESHTATKVRAWWRLMFHRTVA